MLNNEAMWIKNNLSILSLKKESTVLNFGSQNLKYNNENKNLLDMVINPIKDTCTLRNLDLQSGDGIDYSGDLYEETFFCSMKSNLFDCILLCNVLEHVTNIGELAHRISQLVKPKSYIVFSGPYSYPVHYDPIDNGFRPEIEEVLDLFADFKMIKGEIITDYSYSYYLFSSFKLLVKTFFRVLVPFYKFENWKNVVLPKFKWWNKNYEVICVIMQKK